ncbi:MAG: FtsX-like permease family protein [Lachnospiraceae bacterium]|nr:FtsX-like permease family protein [Lachnospiraceae bacterium]
MKNPLNKRIPKNIKKDWKKYLVLCLLLILTISVVSAMYVGNNGMEKAFADAYSDYNIEDGHFELKDEPTEALLSAMEAEGIKIYSQKYKEVDEDIDEDGTADATVRVFEIREDVNLTPIKAGAMAAKDDEIVMDFRHAGNQGLKPGDKVKVDGRILTVSGLAYFSDYSTLFKKNSDIMFDALTFNVAVVTPECFDSLDANTVWQYTYKYNDKPETDEEKKELADDLIPKIAVLSATGGYLDDEDEANELKDNIEVWTDYLEEVQEEADALTARKEDLEARAKALEAEGADLEKNAMTLFMSGVDVEARADALKAKGEELKKEGDLLQKDAEALEDKQPVIDEYVDNLENLEQYEDDINELTDFVPEYACQSIHFAPDDMGKDKTMCEVLLIVFVVVLAFIFAITASNTITNEAKVIGTLRASGYTKGELLRHYIAAPVILTVISAIIGNILGYTVLKNAVVAIYGHSYSLPPLKTYFDTDAFVRTTVFPVITVLLINLLIVYLKLRIDPLRFLRGDLSSKKKKKAMKLPDVKFFSRFRMRILGQNLPGYMILFAGIFFVMVLILFSVGMPNTLNKYLARADEFAIAPYLTVLKDTEDEDGEAITTSVEGAEKFSMDNLTTTSGVRVGEDVTVYGYIPGSRFFNISDDPEKGSVYVSQDYADKFRLTVGDTVELKAKFAKDAYRFTVAGIHPMRGTIAILMPNDDFNDVLGYDEGSFSGFASDREITDIDEKYVASVITAEDLVSMANQLSYSMGGMMNIFSYACGAMAILVIYLITKIIIENNATSISMVKVLGYTDREISSLYVHITTLVTIFSAIATAWISYIFVAWLWRAIMNGMAGWFAFDMDFLHVLKCVVIILAAYAVVAFLDLRRIRRVPLTEALKNAE